MASNDSNPEKAAREFLALLPEGCEPRRETKKRGRFEFAWGNDNLTVRIAHYGGIVSLHWRAWINENRQVGQLIRPYRSNEIPPDLMKRIEEFER